MIAQLTERLATFLFSIPAHLHIDVHGGLEYSLAWAVVVTSETIQLIIIQNGQIHLTPTPQRPPPRRLLLKRKELTTIDLSTPHGISADFFWSRNMASRLGKWSEKNFARYDGDGLHSSARPLRHSCLNSN